jgi:membrane protein insertase Oxa1/YidC/SpoIIIJ
MRLPAGVTFYFALAAALGMVQNAITMQPWFRRWAGLALLPTPPKTTYQPPRGGANTSTLGAVKEQFSQVLKDARSGQGGMMERMQAKAEAEKEEKARAKRDEQHRRDLKKRLERRKR